MLQLTCRRIQRILSTTAVMATSALALFAASTADAAISSTERAALVAFYNSTGGPSWSNSSGLWTVAAAPGNECTWAGVVCAPSVTGETVVDLTLPANNLVGSLPANFTDLFSLQYLRLQNNQLSGSIAALSSLMQLRYVDLGKNQFTGSIPPLAALTALQVFSVPNNQLTGTIPALSSLTNLQVFSVSSNQLTGTIPSLAALTSLRMFYVNSNQLTGSLPELDGLTNLQSFYAGANLLTGPVAPLTGMVALRHYRVENNQLTGGIATLAGLSALEVFYISGNQLSGTIPPVPVPTALVDSLSALCSNQFTASADAAWDAATPGAIWSAGCTSVLPSQTLVFGPVPVLTAARLNGPVDVSSSPLPGSSAPIVYSSLTPSICTVNASSGMVTLLAAVPMGSICTIAANKAGDASYNSAVQVAQAIKISAVCRLDVNRDGQHTALDAVLIARYLAGIRGNALIAGLVPPLGGFGATAADIEAFLAAQDYDVRGMSPSNPSATRDLVVANRYINGIPASPQLVFGTDIPTDLPTTSVIFNRLASWCNF